jgi:glycogen debranching enzyme
VERRYGRWLAGTTSVETDNDFFDAAHNRALRDLRMLWNDGHNAGYPAAGTPWYDTLFGRDTAVTGLQTLWLKPSLAKSCLLALASRQGTAADERRDEEPGKILHELRVGELTQSGVLPFSPYYGSVDSTPLFLVLAAEYYRWTADIGLMRRLEKNLEAGLAWLHRYGDSNGDGYLDYSRTSPEGLVNQSWKDSWDAMIDEEGDLLDPPIAPAEVQGYVYAALSGLAPVFSALGERAFARELDDRAAALAAAFRRDFWAGGFGLAISGDGRLSKVSTSNAGQVLWSGIPTRSQAAVQARRLFHKDMFSGWGIRTLSTGCPRYNPQGYHVGTVWPHDNSIIAMGLKRYGFEDHLERLATGLFDAARSFPYYRLPELFGGEERSGHHPPVPYPVACRPQAWAAGALPLVTQAVLGLCPDAPGKRLLIVRPCLPHWLTMATIGRLKVGEAECDLCYERRGDETRVQVLGTRGDLAVSVVDNWPAG